MPSINFSDIKYYLPLTYPWQLRRLIPSDTKTIIDVGCGDGYTMNWVSFGKSYKITGVEVDEQSIKKAKKSRVYQHLVKANLTRGKLTKSKYDVVLCSQVVEHLKKAEGLKLIGLIEQLATKRVIIATTHGFIEYDHGPVKNRFDKHQSGWEINDFSRLGYKVLGHGLKWIYKPGGIKEVLPQFLTPLLFLVSYLITPVLMYFPKPVLFLIAYKDIK